MIVNRIWEHHLEPAWSRLPMTLAVWGAGPVFGAGSPIIFDGRQLPGENYFIGCSYFAAHIRAGDERFSLRKLEEVTP
jgi:hypothetical protein